VSYPNLLPPNIVADVMCITHRSPNLDVQRVDAQLLAPRRDVLRSQHGSIGRRLVAIRLDLHAARHAAKRFAPRQIGDVHECVVEAREDACYAEDELAYIVANVSTPSKSGSLTSAALGAGSSFDEAGRRKRKDATRTIADLRTEGDVFLYGPCLLGRHVGLIERYERG
jgi:hypothetical protein